MYIFLGYRYSQGGMLSPPAVLVVITKTCFDVAILDGRFGMKFLISSASTKSVGIQMILDIIETLKCILINPRIEKPMYLFFHIIGCVTNIIITQTH